MNVTGVMVTFAWKKLFLTNPYYIHKESTR